MSYLYSYKEFTQYQNEGINFDSIKDKLDLTMNRVKSSRLNPKNIKISNDQMATIHLGLDLIGLIPGLGSYADAANVVLYLKKGDFLFAGLSLISILPGIGEAIGKSEKLARTFNKLGPPGRAMLEAGKSLTKTKQFSAVAQHILKMRRAIKLKLDTVVLLMDYVMKLEDPAAEPLKPYIPRMKEALIAFAQERPRKPW